MSTTDTQVKFEAWAKDYGYKFDKFGSTSAYESASTNHAFAGFKAATEAAKATGTAGEPMTMSYVQNVPDHCDRITWRGAYYHLKEGAEAARQPAPVVAVNTWQDRLNSMHSEDGHYGYVQMIQARDAEIADLRAALAATNRSQPMPVVMPEMPPEGVAKAMAKAWWSGTSAYVMKTTDAYRIYAAIREVLAARSQP